jgi:predicted dehydrogenase
VVNIGAALVGSGFIGPVHVEALRRLGVPVVGVLGSSKPRSEATAKLLGIPRAYADFDDLLADDRVGVVHLASPNRLHFAQAHQALQVGKHVICEKPLAMNSAETSQLVARAAASDRVAAVCYNLRFYPLCLEARERIASGQLGEIFHVTGSYTQDWLLLPTDFNWRVLTEDGGELRAIADIGTHWFDLVQHVTGLAITQVCADLKTVWPTRQCPVGSVETFQSKLGVQRETLATPITTDDFGALLLRFENDARGGFHVSQVSAGRKNRLTFEIAGANGSLAWDSERPNELWIGHRDRPNELLIRDPALLHAAVRPFANYPGGHNEGFPDSFKQLFRAVYAAIDHSDPVANYPTFVDGHREMLLCDAVLRSHRERRWVEVDPV